MEVEREQHKRCDVVLGSDVYSQNSRTRAVSWRYCFVLKFAGQGSRRGRRESRPVTAARVAAPTCDERSVAKLKKEAYENSTMLYTIRADEGTASRLMVVLALRGGSAAFQRCIPHSTLFPTLSSSGPIYHTPTKYGLNDVHTPRTLR